MQAAAREPVRRPSAQAASRHDWHIMGVAPSPAHLLAVWDQAYGQPPADRVRALLRATDASATDAQLGRLTVGEADRRLLALRDTIFGDRFDAVCRCPRCREMIAIEFRSSDFGHVGPIDAPIEIDAGGHRIAVRLPTVADLAQAAAAGTVDDARATLIAQCITSARTLSGESVLPRSLPMESIAAISAALEQADPIASTTLQVQCPACTHAWASAFDVSGYLWAELDAWADGLLSEVHVLARAYGWSESQILALSPLRRRHYLDLVVA